MSNYLSGERGWCDFVLDFPVLGGVCIAAVLFAVYHSARIQTVEHKSTGTAVTHAL
jgi:hypothetical protein